MKSKLFDLQNELEQSMQDLVPEPFQQTMKSLLNDCITEAMDSAFRSAFLPPKDNPIRVVCPTCGSERVVLCFVNVAQAGIETSVSRLKVETLDIRKSPAKGYSVICVLACKPAGHTFTVELASDTPDRVTINGTDVGEICQDAVELARNETYMIPPEFLAQAAAKRRKLFHRAEKETDPLARLQLWMECAKSIGIDSEKLPKGNESEFAECITADDLNNEMADKIRRMIEVIALGKGKES